MDYPIDARQKPLGRVASEIAAILQGKKNPSYDPRLVGEDKALLKNYKEVIVVWYSSGPKIRPHDIEINEVFRKYCTNPVFVVIDVQDKVLIIINFFRKLLVYQQKHL